MGDVTEFIVDGFNPRSREGSDLWCNHTGLFYVVSIHAPAKGATSVGHIWR